MAIAWEKEGDLDLKIGTIFSVLLKFAQSVLEGFASRRSVSII